MKLLLITLFGCSILGSSAFAYDPDENPFTYHLDHPSQSLHNYIKSIEAYDQRAKNQQTLDRLKSFLDNQE